MGFDSQVRLPEGNHHESATTLPIATSHGESAVDDDSLNECDFLATSKSLWNMVVMVVIRLTMVVMVVIILH